jgi:hypothetical protein
MQKTKTPLTATVMNPQNIRVYRGALWVGSVQQIHWDGRWSTLMNSTSTRSSRANYRTPAEAAQARWGARGRKAVEAALADVADPTETMSTDEYIVYLLGIADQKKVSV